MDTSGFEVGSVRYVQFVSQTARLKYTEVLLFGLLEWSVPEFCGRIFEGRTVADQ